MDEITKNVEGRSTVTAAEMYKAMFLDMDVVIPQILPQLIKSIHILEGDGGVGTIKYLTYGQGINYFVRIFYTKFYQDSYKIIIEHYRWLMLDIN